MEGEEPATVAGWLLKRAPHEQDKYLQKPWNLKTTMRTTDLNRPSTHAHNPRQIEDALSPKRPTAAEWMDVTAEREFTPAVQTKLKELLDRAFADLWPPKDL
jgi:hypothetical protein